MNRTRAAISVGIVLLVTCGEPSPRAASGGGDTTQPKGIFRTVHLAGSDVVVLGQPLHDKQRLGKVLGDSVVRLDDARFGGATDIRILLAPGDTVRGMIYDYGPDSAFEARVADYVQLLGPPARRYSRGTRDVDLTDVVEWNDSVTHFELRWITRGSGAVAQSVLLDRRLGGSRGGD